MLAVCSDQDDSNNYEAFSLEVACKVIGDTPQADGIMLLREGCWFFQGVLPLFP